MSEQAKEKIYLFVLKSIQAISVFFLIIYIIVLFWQTFIHAYGTYERFPQALIEFNLIPLKTILYYMQNFNQLLKDQDLSNWTHQKYNEYIQVQSEKNNAPPAVIKQEILERGLPQDINSGVAKEFHGWENMLAYTNEAIIAMYEARQESEALFRKGEAYRLAVRAAYLREVKG